MASPPDVSIIIVSWNVRELLRANLARIAALPDHRTREVFVVDNGSADGTAATVRSEFPGVRLITNDWDAGFAWANNQALRQAKGTICLLLNPDMLVEPDALDAAYDALVGDPTIGVLGGHLLHADGTPIIGSVRRFPNLASQLAVLLKLGRLFPRLLNQYLWSNFDFTRSQDVDQVRGSFFAFRRALLDAVGFLDSGYHLWFEEVDYCCRVRAAGLRVRYCAEATARDYIGKSFAQMHHLEKQRIFTASMLRYFRKWHPRWQWMLLTALRPLALLAAMGVDIGKRVQTNMSERVARIGGLPIARRRLEHERGWPATGPASDRASQREHSHAADDSLALQLSCYNGSRYLPFLFRSLARQTHRTWALHVLDNASRPDEALAMRAAVAAAAADGLTITLHRVEQNLGFAGAHNFLFTKHHADFVQLLNDDAFLEPDYLATCLTHLVAHPNVAAVSGKILRWDFDQRKSPHGGRTTLVDSLGLRIRWTGRVEDIGAGRQDEWVARNGIGASGWRGSGGLPLRAPRWPSGKHGGGDPQQAPQAGPHEVFGVSGCLPMYRASAIRRASDDGTLFDASYVSYKEDVDLALRLRALGMTAAVLPAAVAYHRRTLGPRTTARPSPEARRLSYRNHLWLLLAHATPHMLFVRQPGIVPFEVAKAAWWLLRHPRTFTTALRETSAAWPRLMQKRAFIGSMRATQRLPAAAHETPAVDLAIVMVSHNDLNAACLASLAAARAASALRTAVVVVDNASTHYDANAVVAEHLPDAIVLLRNGDFGFGKSCNRGAAEVRARYYCFLNPDTVLTDPRVLDMLVAYLDARPGVGIVAPKIFYPDGRLQDTVRRFPAWFMPFIQRTSLRDSAFGKRYTAEFLMTADDHAHERPVDWAQGSCLCIRGDLWHVLGGFDERFHMYYEDIDLCRNAWRAGYQVRYLPSVVLIHAHGRQSARIRNILVNIWKTQETRWHLQSWAKYMWKWFHQPIPTRS